MDINSNSFKTNFKGIPKRYMRIDKYLSRSGQPSAADFKWLKEQGVTDIINFRTTAGDFNEQKTVKTLGMNYHTIKTDVLNPTEDNIKKFLKLTNKIIKKGRKVHIHCQAGADRTGMYAFIYKSMNNIGTPLENELEWINNGHNYKMFAHLRPWAKNILNKLQ